MWASRFHARSPAAVGLLIRFLFIGSRLCSTLLSDPASRRSPCASLSLLLHQDGKRTFTSQLLNMLGTHEKRRCRWAAPGAGSVNVFSFLSGDSAKELRSRHIERVIDQWLHAFDESYRMRQPGVILECLLVCPARVNVEQSRVSGRAKGVNTQTASFLAGRTQNITHRLRNSTLVARSGVKTREDE